MTQVTVARRIDAPVETVFRAVSDIGNLPETNPDVVRIEFLSSTKAGVGTRFRETRTMKGRESVTELDVTELVENEHVRMVADSHGTVWDTVFTVAPSETGTELRITMDAKAHKLLPRLFIPLAKGLFKKGLEAHIDAVRAYCEAERSSVGP